MGGFRVNGCGVTDHYKCIKSLGMHICPSCKKLAEFTLNEANQKIDVLWIPTLTLKSRYAVMCKKCKNGEFCSAEWAGHLMNQTSCPEIFFESQAKEREGSFKCEHCGITQVREGKFCAYCGKPAPAPETLGQSEIVEEGTVCPQCGSEQKAGAKFCSRCGQNLTAVPVTEKKCPYCGAKLEEGILFCMECGTKVPE